MGYWETRGQSDDWYTPRHIFAALNCQFDMDVAATKGGGHVPALYFERHDGLGVVWRGFVWMNPPFGGRNGLEPWLAKFFTHGNGIALTPDRTSAPWFQTYGRRASAILFLPKVKFERPDGSLGRSPSNGTALMAAGPHASKILRECNLGLLVTP